MGGVIASVLQMEKLRLKEPANHNPWRETGLVPLISTFTVLLICVPLVIILSDVTALFSVDVP